MRDKSSNSFRVAARDSGSGFGSEGIADVLGAIKSRQLVEHLEDYRNAQLYIRLK